LASKTLKPHLWFTLYNILKLGGGKAPIKVSTTELSKALGGSQQSASRHLQLLEKEGYISRRIDTDGSLINVSNKGLKALDDMLQDLKGYLEGDAAEPFIFEGTVTSGLFEGAYYMQKDGYRRQIKEKLGFDPFPGTLNLKIEEVDYDKRRRLEKSPSAILDGFKDGERSFGAVKCYPLILANEVRGALVVADRTIHDLATMEIISPIYLRRHFQLADGDKVKIAFLTPRRSSS
jgi:riboflavin kinase